VKKIEIHPDAVERVKKFSISDPHLGFGKHVAPIMIQGVYQNGEWQKFDLLPYQPLQLDPCSKVFHYAQEIFEGLKVYKTPQDTLSMFRPEMNARRFNLSAKRMAMPELDEKQFLLCCETISQYCKHLVPRRSGESLYLRPFMIGTEFGLGVKPSKEFLFIIVASPSGNYFGASSVKVYIERDEVRCAPGGIGSAKAGGNYAASLHSYNKTIEKGCDQTMWLDAVEHKYIEEMSGMNFFAIINNSLVTPRLKDTILDGVTRDSILQLAVAKGLKVVEKNLSIDEILSEIENENCTEAFVCGTAAVIVPISEFHDKDGSVYHLKKNQFLISDQIKNELIDLQMGKMKDQFQWNYPIQDLNF